MYLPETTQKFTKEVFRRLYCTKCRQREQGSCVIQRHISYPSLTMTPLKLPLKVMSGVYNNMLSVKKKKKNSWNESRSEYIIYAWKFSAIPLKLENCTQDTDSNTVYVLRLILLASVNHSWTLNHWRWKENCKYFGGKPKILK